MSEEAEDFEHQAKVFKALNSTVRLRLLKKATEQKAISAPGLADDFDITPESIKNNLNQLEAAGFLESSRVRGPGNRPRDEFTLPGNGIELQFELIPDDYLFRFEEADIISDY